MTEDRESRDFRLVMIAYFIAMVFIVAAVADSCRGCVVELDRNARECGEWRK